MSPTLTDRQIVELALPAFLVRRAYAAGLDAADRLSEDDRQVMAWLDEARAAPFEAVADRDRAAKLRARVMRLQTRLLAPYEQRPLMLVHQMVLFLLRDLLAEEVLVLVEGSAFDRAASALIEALSADDLDDLWRGMQSSAEKNARRLRQRLAVEGYYVVRRSAAA